MGLLNDCEFPNLVETLSPQKTHILIDCWSVGVQSGVYLLSHKVPFW